MSNALSIRDQLKAGKSDYVDQIAQALPSHINPDRMVRMVLTSFAEVPKLAQCDAASVWKSVLSCCAIGLEPGALGHAYLLPYNTKEGMKCQLQMGYKGLIELAMRSGKVSSIYADAVHDNDEFIYERGTDEKLVHKPCMRSDRGEAYCYYAYAKMKDGGFNADVMFMEDILAIKDRAKASFGPWKTDFSEMAKKTVIKRLCKKLPLSPELHEAIHLDNQSTGIQTVQPTQQPTFSLPVPEKQAEQEESNVDDLDPNYGESDNEA